MDPHRRHHQDPSPPRSDSRYYPHQQNPIRFSSQHHHQYQYEHQHEHIASPSQPSYPQHRYFPHPQHHHHHPYIPTTNTYAPHLSTSTSTRDVFLYVPHPSRVSDRIIYSEEDFDADHDVTLRLLDARDFVPEDDSSEIVARKRQRLALPHEEDPVDYWSGAHGGLHRRNEGFESEPSSVLVRSGSVPRRYGRASPELFERGRGGYAPDEFQVDDYDEVEDRDHEFVERREFSGKSKNYLFYSAGSSKDVGVAPRKRSVWQRLEEYNPLPVPPPPPPHVSNFVVSPFDRDDTEVPAGLDFPFKSNTFPGKETSLTPSKKELNINYRGKAASVERTAGKEPLGESSALAKPGGKAPAITGVPKKKYIGKPAADETSGKKAAVEVVCSPKISPLKSNGDGKVTSVRGPKEKRVNETPEKPASKTVGNYKSVEVSNEVGTKRIAVTVPKPSSSTRQVGTLLVSEKLPGDKPANHVSASDLILKASTTTPSQTPSSDLQALPTAPSQTPSSVLQALPNAHNQTPSSVVQELPDAPNQTSSSYLQSLANATTEKKVVEKIVGSSVAGPTKTDKKVSTTGMLKKRVVIRKRLVPRGTIVTKSVKKATTVGAPAVEMAKAVSGGAPDVEVSKVETSREKVKLEIPFSPAPSLPDSNKAIPCEQIPIKELDFGNNVTLKVFANKMQHIPKRPIPLVTEDHKHSPKLKKEKVPPKEALVSNVKSDVDDIVQANKTAEQKAILPVAPAHKIGGVNAVGAEISVSQKLPSGMTTMRPLVFPKSELVTAERGLQFTSSNVSELLEGKPKEDSASTGNVIKSTIAKKNLILQNPSMKHDAKVDDSLGPENRIRRNIEASSSSLKVSALPGPIRINESCCTKSPVTSIKDPLHSKEAQASPSTKKRRRKRKKKVATIAMVRMNLAEEICKAVVPISIQKEPMDFVEEGEIMQSMDPCCHYNGLQEAPPPPLPCRHGNPHIDHNQFRLADGTVEGNLGFTIADGFSSQSSWQHEVLHKSSEIVEANFLEKKTSVVSGALEDGGCISFKNCEVDKFFHGKVAMEQTLGPQTDGVCEAVPVKVAIPFSSVSEGRGESKIVQEQALAMVESCFQKAGFATGCEAYDAEKPSEGAPVLPHDVACKATVLLEGAPDGCFGRDVEGKPMFRQGIDMKKTYTMSMETCDQNDSFKNECTQQSNLKKQEMSHVLPLDAQGFDSADGSSVATEQGSGDIEMLESNGLIGSRSFSCVTTSRVDESASRGSSDLDSKRPNQMVTKQEHNLQIEQVNGVHGKGFLVDNPDDDFVKKTLLYAQKLSNAEPRAVADSEKRVMPTSVVHDKNTPLSLKGKPQTGGPPQVMAREETRFAKEGHDRAKRMAFPQHATLSARHPVKVTSGLNGRNRTWRRTDPTVVAQSPMHLNISITNSMHRQTPKVPERTQGSYVRKGNSLIRKTSEVIPSAPTLPIPGNLNKTILEISKARPLEATTSNCAEYAKPGQTSAIKRSKTLPLPFDSKQSGCSTNLHSSQDHLLNDSFDAAMEEQVTLIKTQNFDPSIAKNSSGSASTMDHKANDPKRMVYVKHKSNQLVATNGFDMINSPPQFNANSQALPSSSFDLYYMRTKNKLIRDTSSDSLTKRDNLNSFSTSNRKGEVPSKKPHGRLASKVAHKGKTNQSKFSLVWRLNSVNTHGKGATCHMQPNLLPLIFPWKRATYRKTSMMNTSKNYSLGLISKKLLITRKRDAVYTISRGGFALRKSGVRSIGGRSLKWSKSIEKRAKKANKEATLAVAEVERAQRQETEASHPCANIKNKKCISKERIIRVGNVRYKMDSSKRVLIRIPDENSMNNLETRNDSLMSIIPRRLVVGHDEYVRLGNGNQLVRDPKRHVRILASEKVRWSLHTARLRLAKKQQYCQFFTRYGKCNKEGKNCPYIHDPSKIAICTKFLKGLCSGMNCPLTHKVIPERMPDCSYFLQGHCTNATCHYRHVNVNPRASVCEGFLKGYCHDGDECQKKHSYVCPDFETTGKCFQGSDCKLHHPKAKSKSKKRKRSEVKTHSSGRYFVYNMKGTGHQLICGSDKNIHDGKKGDIFSDGQMADYISLDFGSREHSTDEGDQLDLLPNDFDSDLSDSKVYDLDAFIKPIRIMNTAVHNRTNSAAASGGTAD